MINVTPAAASKINELLVEENKESAGLRVFVQGGGCSGFQYGLMIDEGEGDATTDAVIESNGVKLLVDPISARYLSGAEVDFVDNITEVGGHKPLSLLCARQRVPCICQKPMAASLADAEEMVATFTAQRTPFFVHENWRWQTPMRALKAHLDSGAVGTPFRNRVN